MDGAHRALPTMTGNTTMKATYTIRRLTVQYNSARAGLVSANKGNPFWTKRDAFQTLNMARANFARSVK